MTLGRTWPRKISDKPNYVIRMQALNELEFAEFIMNLDESDWAQCITSVLRYSFGGDLSYQKSQTSWSTGSLGDPTLGLA